MNKKLYFKNLLPSFLLQILCMLLLSLFLLAIGNSFDSILFILFTWIGIDFTITSFAYQKRKKELEKLLQLQEQLKEQ